MTDIAKFLDHTLLKPAATRSDIRQLCEEAKEYGFAAACVNPYYVQQAVRELAASKTAVACTVGFPLGANLTDVKIAEAQRAIAEGAEELDMVINLGALREGELDFVAEEVRAIVRVAKGRIVKTIIECDLLNDNEKVAAAKLCAEAGASMVKTSTGFVKDGRGATVEDVALLKKALAGTSVGIKASGGIRTLEKAQALINAGAVRLGTSSSVAIVKEARQALDVDEELSASSA